MWTTRLSSWWPKGHSASGDPDTVVTLEPRLGGRIFERTPDGTEIDWGEITSWNPPTGLGYLWHIGRDRSDATDVELTFVDLGDGTTRLEIVHTAWDRLGAEAGTGRSQHPRLGCAGARLHRGGDRLAASEPLRRPDRRTKGHAP